MASDTLTLRIKAIYFDEIMVGYKLEEYRLIKPYWCKRLLGNSFKRLVLTRGYPKGGGEEGVTRLTLPWRGFRMKKITHPEFGSRPCGVFAIDVSPAA